MREPGRGSAVSPTGVARLRLTYMLCIGLFLAIAVGGAQAVTVSYGEIGANNPNFTPMESSGPGCSVEAADKVCSSTSLTSKAGDLVLGSESGELVFDTEQGYIEVLDYYYPDVLPLCLTQDEVGTWYVSLYVVGGYELVCGYVDIWQKGEPVGTIFMQWTHQDGARCCEDYWFVTFYLAEPLCLDSNQYPTVCDPFTMEQPYDTIPDKEVYFDIFTCWTGCEQPSQHFTITPTHSQSAFESPPQGGIISLSKNGDNLSLLVIC